MKARSSPLMTAMVVAVAFGLVSAGRAQATTCAPPPGASARIGEIDARQRLRWIDARLGEEARRARLWAGGWAIGIGAAGLGSLAAVPFVAASDRVDWYTSAVTAAVGVVPFLVAPLSVTGDAPKLRAALEITPWDDERLCALLADGEAKLAADAADERRQQGWWIHAGNLAFNTGVLLFLGLGYGHWTSGIVNGASGAVVGEAIILTQPTGLTDELGAYNRGELSQSAQRDGARHALGWSYAATF